MGKSRLANPKIVAVDAAGKASRVRAERVEIELGNGAVLSIDLGRGSQGEIELHAESAEGLPVIRVQPGACNLLNVRVEIQPDAGLVDAGINLPQSAVPPLLTLEVQKAIDDAERAAAPKKHKIRRWAQAALMRDAEVTVRLVDEPEGRALNRDYRGKDYATNVLTFAYGEDEAGGPLSGDLVLCVPVVLREAAEQGKAAEAHFAHLVVHGMLHLQGFDHEEADEAERMEALERQIMTTLGYADPYGSET